MNYAGLPMIGIAWLMWVGAFASSTRRGRTVHFDRADPFDDDRR